MSRSAKAVPANQRRKERNSIASIIIFLRHLPILCLTVDAVLVFNGITVIAESVLTPCFTGSSPAY
ncbi:hypothetical protein F6P96_00815 [Escherichia coli]|nr:hypothetical protein F6P96_00815 [Escherichia coli]